MIVFLVRILASALILSTHFNLPTMKEEQRNNKVPGINMPKILIPPKGGNPPPRCENHPPPILRGSYYEYDLASEDFKFWKALTNDEREKLREQAFTRCLYDAIREMVKSSPKKAPTSILFGRTK